MRTLVIGILIVGGGLLPLLAVDIPSGIAESSTCGGMSWMDCAKIAWRYFMPYPQGGWDSSTGLHYDTYNWHYFTLWGLAAYIIALVHADELGIVDTLYPFDVRAVKVLTFLNNEALTSTGLPYLAYDATTGSPATNLDANMGPTNVADYGRLLIALYLLKQRALSNYPYSAIPSMVDSAVARIDTTRLLPQGSAADDFYRYYFLQGFRLWGRSDLNFDWFKTTYQNGPWADSSKLFGVSNVPLTKIDSEPFLNFIFELNPSSDFMTLARRVYEVQEARWQQTGNLTAWTEGALSEDPHFVYEWIVLPPNNYWVIQGPDQTPGVYLTHGQNLPVIFTKTALGMHAVFNTQYTSTLAQQLIQHSPVLYGSNGFFEGVSESSVIDSAMHVQTEEMVIDAADYVLSQPSGSTASSVSTTSSSTSILILEYNSRAVPALALILMTATLFLATRLRRKRHAEHAI
jgi:hypothetical protein